MNNLLKSVSMLGRLLAIALPLVVLGGCGGGLGPSGGGIFGGQEVSSVVACPRVAILEAPGELTRFRDGKTGSIADVIFQARMEVSNVECEIDDDVIFIGADTKLVVARGPAEKKGEVEMTWFVAVLDGSREVILRQAFPLIIKFKPDETRIEFEDSYGIEITRKKDVDPSVYSVYAGFEMTPAELAFSRQRLK